MDEHFIKIHKWLYPVSWIYGAVVVMRNKLFDWGIFRSKSFDVPVICVGNLAVGGTGKTPHTEYLIKLLRDKYQVAVLSRGYKRRTKGYVLATPQFPAGRLREPVSGKNRAQIVIVTKCPQDIKPIDYNIITKRLNLYPYQRLFFSSFRYGNLQPVFSNEGGIALSLLTDTDILLITGIASPAPILERLGDCTKQIDLLSFGDHHDFTHKDMQQIRERFNKLKGKRRLIITTEKDATRLINHPGLDAELKPFIYALPIEIEILQNQQDKFNQHIIDYVRENTRNRSLPERKDAHQS